MITSKNKSYFVYANAECFRRSIEASKLSRYFDENGLFPAASPNKADLIIIFTCGGFRAAEDFSILTIEKSLKCKSAKVIVTGCLTKIDRDILRPYDNLLIVMPEDLGIIDSLIQAKVPYNESVRKSCIVRNVHDHYRAPFARIKYLMGNLNYTGLNSEHLKTLIEGFGRNLRHRSFDSIFAPKVYMLEISKGCLSECSYCAIKLAAEKFHSFPEDLIVKGLKEGLKGKYKNFNLVASDIGCYGVDINTNLPNLLIRLFSVEGDYKIILEDLNARWLVKYYSELLPVLRTNYRKISKVVFPIQSGSDRILKLMNRGYEIDEVKKCILDLNKRIPKIKLGTHIIVGFPGETDEDFQKSIELVRAIYFNYVSVFWYEERPGTKALHLPDKVEKETITKRARLLAKEANKTGAYAFLFNPTN